MSLKCYKLSKAIPLKVFIRAYELWNTTDMTQVEVARALQINKRTLNAAITKAEKDGIYEDRVLGSSTKMVYECLQETPGRTCAEVAASTGLGLHVVRERMAVATKKGILKRRVERGSRTRYRYYINEDDI